MPGKADRIPKYRLHKASGRAVVTLSGRDYYLGRHGSDASRGGLGELKLVGLPETAVKESVLR